MSSLHGTIRRYQLIIEKLKRNTFPSKREVMDYLHQRGFENSERTMQRDFEKIRYEFGVEIVYNRTRRGYGIEKESEENIEPFLRLARLSQLTEIMARPSGKERDVLNYISFESRGDLRGLEHLAPLLEAVRSRLKVHIRHTPFYRKETGNYELWPFMLREYLERWYVVAWVKEKGAFRSFGVDRIHEVRVTDEVFDRREHPDPAEFFKDAIGVVYSTHDVETVELAFDSFQGKYIKALPIHDSQAIAEDSERRLLVRLRIRPNFELKRKILGYGSAVKVLEPKWLAEEVAKELRKNIGQYD